MITASTHAIGLPPVVQANQYYPPSPAIISSEIDACPEMIQSEISLEIMSSGVEKDGSPFFSCCYTGSEPLSQVKHRHAEPRESQRNEAKALAKYV